MRRSSATRRLLDNTRLVGAAALAVGAAAVAISYSAQNGLPLAGTYHVYADVPDAAKLTAHADVRIGGARVGQVLRVRAQPRRGSRPPFARLELGLDASARPLPADTTAEVRLASVLGGKYLALVPGHSRSMLAEHGGLPLRQGIPSVDTDEALRVFRPAARGRIQRVIGGLADGLVGRGQAVNRSTASLATSLPAADRVLRTLLAPRTDLAALLPALAAATGALAPVAAPAGSLLEHAAVTAGALDRAGDALDRTLTALPPAESHLTAALTAARPALADAAAISRALAPAGAELPGALRALHRTASAAIPVARAARTLAAPLGTALAAVDHFGRSTTSRKALKALGTNDLATFGGSAFIGLGAILQSASEGQLHCNTLALWVRNLASTASEGDRGGNWLRMLPVFQVDQMQHARTMSPDLHVNVYPHEDASECESGNEPFRPGRQLGNPAGLQSRQVPRVTPGAVVRRARR